MSYVSYGNSFKFIIAKCNLLRCKFKVELQLRGKFVNSVNREFMIVLCHLELLMLTATQLPLA